MRRRGCIDQMSRLRRDDESGLRSTKDVDCYSMRLLSLGADVVMSLSGWTDDCVMHLPELRLAATTSLEAHVVVVNDVASFAILRERLAAFDETSNGAEPKV